MFGTNEIRKVDPYQDPDVLDVHETFATIQGEGPYAGHPAWFIRLSGCSLKCYWCFGWRDMQGRQPFVYLSNGAKKKLGAVVSGDVILTMDDELNVVETTVTAKHEREVDEWLRIKIAGRTYWVTPEHPFFTTRGQIPAARLRVGDTILEVKSNDIIAFKKLAERNPMKRAEVAAKVSSSLRASGLQSERVSTNIAQRKAAGTYRASWHSLTPEQQLRIRRKLSRSRMGKRNPNWRDDHPQRNFVNLKKEVRVGYHDCARCGSNHRLQVHHRDRDQMNDDADNFEVLCQSCHSLEHENGYNFWKSGRRKDGKQLIAAKGRNGKVVQSIKRVNINDRKYFASTKPKPLTVHNLTCQPYNTFLADGMWVHNCDTDFSQVHPTPVAQLVEEAEVWRSGSGKSNLVVITGGEPLVQNLTALLPALVTRGFKVQIETAGTHPVVPLDLLRRDARWLMDISIVCSPKTPKIDLQIAHRACAFKYIIGHDDDLDPGDGLPISSTQVQGKMARLYRPVTTAPIYVQPRDDQDSHRNELNLQKTVSIARRYGYVCSLQLHKLLHLP